MVFLPFRTRVQILLKSSRRREEVVKHSPRSGELEEITGYDRKTIQNAKHVAEATSSPRREDLSFKHHAEVAPLPAPELSAGNDRGMFFLHTLFEMLYNPVYHGGEPGTHDLRRRSAQNCGYPSSH